jgi:hypothetical protein
MRAERCPSNSVGYVHLINTGEGTGYPDYGTAGNGRNDSIGLERILEFCTNRIAQNCPCNSV